MKTTKTDNAELVLQAAELLAGVEVDFSLLQEKKNAKLPGLSDADFAKIIGIKPSTLCDYKNPAKKARPSLLVAVRASLALGVDWKSFVPGWQTIQNDLAEIIR